MNTIERINKLLETNGVSAAKMMRDLGFSSGLYSQWKSQKQKPSIDKLSKIADYFNVTTDYLLGNTNILWKFNPDEAKDYVYECCMALFKTDEYMGLFYDLQTLNKQGLENAMKYISDLTKIEDYKSDNQKEIDVAMRENLAVQNKKITTKIAAFGGDNKEIELSEDNLRKAVSLIEDDD